MHRAFLPFLIATLSILPLFKDGHARTFKHIYTVAHVESVVKKSSEKLPKKAALINGRLEAFERLVQRLSNQDQTEISITPKQLKLLVKNKIVESENSYGQTYKVIYTFQFHKEAVDNFLAEQNISINPYTKRPVLVIPITTSGNTTLMWENENEKIFEWTRDIQDNVFTLELPNSKELDRKDLSIEQALSKDTSATKRLIDRYESKGLIFVHYNNNTIESWYISENGDLYTVPLEFEASATPTVFMISEQLQDFLFKIETIRDEEEAHLPIIINVKNQRDWIQKRKAIESIPGVKKLKVDGMSNKKIDADIDFLGTISKLQDKLEEKNLVLKRLDNGEWAIKSTTE